MRNLNIQISVDELRSHTYRVSRSSSAYSFFTCEFHNLPEDFYGNIIVPPANTVLEERTGRVGGIVQTLKEKLLKRDESITVPIGSEEHMYFASEYQHTMVEDVHHNIIVPKDEYPKVKTR